MSSLTYPSGFAANYAYTSLGYAQQLTAQPAAGQALPHAVMSISGSTLNTTFTYDPNGNQTGGLGRSITYTSYNKPNAITQGARTLSFEHDFDHQRFKQVTPEGTTLYFDAFGVHVELFSASTSQWNEYLVAGGQMVGVRFERSNGTVATRYFHQDHLGSIAVITDETGAVAERLSYDAWGKRRFPNGADDPSGSITSQTTVGFTGQEELADVGLVHLNGRVYDPQVGRMMSADPFVPDPTDGQAWNRYSYVINNPLAFTDPNGYCFLGLCGLWNSIGTFIDRTIGSALRSYPILGSIIEIGAAAICGAAVICPLVAALTAAAVAGITTGRLDVALKSGLIAGVTAFAFSAVGDLTAHNPDPFLQTDKFLENVAGHALVGCGSAVASGAKCGPSALAGAITSAAGPIVNGHGFVAGLVANTVLGGVAAVAGGGKFENGAITGAFGYLFNYCGGPHGCGDLGRNLGMAGGIIGGGFLAASAELASFGLQTPLVPVEVAAGGAIGGGFGQAVGSILDWIYNSNVAPDPNAVGPHTTWKEDPVTGAKTRTETWVPNPQNPSGWDSGQATDLTGRGHYDKGSGQVIATPHTHLPDGTTRPATPDEIPK